MAHHAAPRPRVPAGGARHAAPTDLERDRAVGIVRPSLPKRNPGEALAEIHETTGFPVRGETPAEPTERWFTPSTTSGHV